MFDKIPEPCLCGDPECPFCFSQPCPEEDPDEAYDRMRQQEIEDENTDE